MRKIREVLRLRAEGFSEREIARSVGRARSSIQICLWRADQARIGWPLPGEQDDAMLEALIRQTKNVQAARQIRFSTLADINKQNAAIAAYISDAISVEKSGVKVEVKSAEQFEVPKEFLKRLDDDPMLAEAFHGLTPGRRKGYLLHFSGARQSATRAARVDRHVPRILKGLGLDD